MNRRDGAQPLQRYLWCSSAMCRALRSRRPFSPPPPQRQTPLDGRAQIFPPHHAARIWRISWLCLASAAVALWCAPDLAVWPVTILCTSLNYWRAPGPGLRRIIDIAAVHVSGIVCMWRSFECDHFHFNCYWAATGLGIALYYVGCTQGGNLDVAVPCHMGLHVLANIGNCFLFYGSHPDIKPQSAPDLMRVFFLGCGGLLAAAYNFLPESVSKKVLCSAPLVPLLLFSLRTICPECLVAA